jgi:hypothetical protein
MNFEDRIELGDLQEILDALGKVEELELTLLTGDGGVAVDEFADAGGVNVADFTEIQEELLVAGGDEVFDSIAEKGGAFAEGDAADRINDGDIANLAGG